MKIYDFHGCPDEYYNGNVIFPSSGGVAKIQRIFDGVVKPDVQHYFKVLFSILFVIPQESNLNFYNPSWNIPMEWQDCNYYFKITLSFRKKAGLSIYYLNIPLILLALVISSSRYS